MTYFNGPLQIPIFKKMMIAQFRKKGIEFSLFILLDMLAYILFINVDVIHPSNYNTPNNKSKLVIDHI
jgi:hypothetical protein